MCKLNSPNVQEHDALLHEIYNASYFFYASFDQLAKQFLSKFVIGEIFELPFEAIRQQVVEQIIDPSVIPEDETAFYTYICAIYLDLDKLPASVMLQYYRTAVSDLKVIEARINDYDEQIATINNKESSLKTEEDSYQLRLVLHYKEANQSAHREILDFLFYRIEDYTIFNSTRRPWVTNLLYGGIPYSFRLISKQLQWESLSDLTNKFGDLTIEEHLELQEFYKAKDKGEFYKKVRSYLTDKRIIEKIKEMISSNHRLNERSRVFQESFDAYSKGSKYLFCSVIALQIEGLFADYCLELGIEETSIRGGSLTDKVRMAARKNTRYRSFEYYAFRFPLIRNKIAHGNLITEDVENLADYLLLDLYDVCLSLASLSLPINKIVSILRLWQQSNGDKKLEVKYCLYREIKVPPFYHIHETELKIQESIIDRSFWDYLSELVKNDYEMLKKGVFKIVTTLKKAEINLSWCKEIFDLLQNASAEGFDEQQFLEELNSMPD